MRRKSFVLYSKIFNKVMSWQYAFIQQINLLGRYSIVGDFMSLKVEHILVECDQGKLYQQYFEQTTTGLFDERLKANILGTFRYIQNEYYATAKIQIKGKHRKEKKCVDSFSFIILDCKLNPLKGN